jgi:hypothetical protein
MIRTGAMNRVAAACEGAADREGSRGFVSSNRRLSRSSASILSRPTDSAYARTSARRYIPPGRESTSPRSRASRWRNGIFVASEICLNVRPRRTRAARRNSPNSVRSAVRLESGYVCARWPAWVFTAVTRDQDIDILLHWDHPVRRRQSSTRRAALSPGTDESSKTSADQSHRAWSERGRTPRVGCRLDLFVWSCHTGKNFSRKALKDARAAVIPPIRVVRSLLPIPTLGM